MRGIRILYLKRMVKDKGLNFDRAAISNYPSIKFKKNNLKRIIARISTHKHKIFPI